MRNPKVSVVISTYNRPEKLKRAIESVQAQTFTDWECIVIHDGPIEIDLGTGNDKITFLALPENFGNDTRPKNEGIKRSKGEYVAFLDDDNCFRPDHLAILVKELDARPEYDGVYGDRWATYEDGSERPRIGNASDFNPSLLLKTNYIDTSDILLRRQALFDVGGWDERFKKYVDWNLWLRMAKWGKKFKHIPLLITDYYIGADSKSAKVHTENEKKYLEWFGQSANIPDWAPITREEPRDFGQFDLEIELPFLGPVPEPKIAVYSITYDRLKYTQAAFESLRKTAGLPFDHFVVDNHSSDGTPAWLRSQQKAGLINTLVLNTDNKGISIASNQAIDAIGIDRYDIIVKFDNDCICLTPGWLKKMVDIWKANHMLALSPYVQGLKDNPGGAPRIGWGLIGGEMVGMTKHLGGICHFVSARAYQDWRWDIESPLHGKQDLEFSQHLLFSGYQMGYLESFYVSHGPLGTEAQKQDFPAYFERRVGEKVTHYETPAA